MICSDDRRCGGEFENCYDADRRNLWHSCYTDPGRGNFGGGAPKIQRVRPVGLAGAPITVPDLDPPHRTERVRTARDVTSVLAVSTQRDDLPETRFDEV